MKVFIASEFGYWSLVWNFHYRKLNSQVKKLHERALRIVYQYFAFSFTESLRKKSRQLYATEISSYTLLYYVRQRMGCHHLL